MDDAASNGTPSDLVQLARDYAETDASKRWLEERLAACKEMLAGMESKLLDAFADAKIKPPIKVELDDGSIVTLTIRHDTWARVAEGRDEDLFSALERSGLGHFVRRTVNTHTLSAWYREVSRSGEEVPDDIKASLAITEAYSVRTRRA